MDGHWKRRLSLLTPEFLDASIDELSQHEPNITLENLRLHHDAGYWRNNPAGLSFIFEHYVALGLNQTQFGSPDFRLALFEGDESGLNQQGGGNITSTA